VGNSVCIEWLWDISACSDCLLDNSAIQYIVCVREGSASIVAIARYPTEETYYSLLRNVQPGSGSHSVDTDGAAGPWCLPLTGVKNEWGYTATTFIHGLTKLTVAQSVYCQTKGWLM